MLDGDENGDILLLPMLPPAREHNDGIEEDDVVM